MYGYVYPPQPAVHHVHKQHGSDNDDLYLEHKLKHNVNIRSKKMLSIEKGSCIEKGVAVNDIGDNDVICGRGGLGNRHPGNVCYREIIKKYQVQYLKAQKREKKTIALDIVDIIHKLNPPGKFLQKDNSTGLYLEIDDKRASEKVSQSLREGAPKIRAAIYEQHVNVMGLKADMNQTGKTNHDDSDKDDILSNAINLSESTSTQIEEMKKQCTPTSPLLNKTDRTKRNLHDNLNSSKKSRLESVIDLEK
jgi:hypothetical protein